MDIRKNLIALIFILGGAALVLVVLNFQKPNLLKKQPAQILEQATDLNKLSQGSSLIKISKSKINFFSAQLDKVLFYEEFNSFIYQSDFGGRKIEVAKIPKATNVIFSPDGEKIIATITESGQSQKTLIDLKNNSSAKLHKNIKEAAFSPNGEKIVYHFFDASSGEGSISISNPDGSDFVNILKTRLTDLKIIWPQKDIIAFYTNSSSGTSSNLFILEPSGKNLKKLVSNKAIDAIKWSNKKFLISIKNADGSVTLLLGESSGKVVDTRLKISASSCGWSGEDTKITCAQGGEIFELNLLNNEKKQLASEINFEPTGVSIPSLGQHFVFINKKDGRLSSFKLP